MALGEPDQAGLEADKALVDIIELLDQRIDARSVQPERLHLADDLVLQLFVLAFLSGGSDSLLSWNWMSWSCSRRSRL